MTTNQAREEIISYWIEKAKEALVSARSELQSGRFAFAMNRAYYACFYAVSAILLKKGKKFSKHSGVRAALHQHLVKPGLVSIELGKIYDQLFGDRQEGDYIELIQFEKEQVANALQNASSFVDAMKKFL